MSTESAWFVLDAGFVDTTGFSTLTIGRDGELIVGYNSSVVRTWYLWDCLAPASDLNAPLRTKIPMLRYNVHFLTAPLQQTMSQHRDWIRSVAISSPSTANDGCRRVFTGGWEQTIRQFASESTTSAARAQTAVAPEPASKDCVIPPRDALQPRRAPEPIADSEYEQVTQVPSLQPVEAQFNYSSAPSRGPGVASVLQLVQLYRSTSFLLAVQPLIDIVIVTAQFSAFPLSGDWPWSSVVEPVHQTLPLIAISLPLSRTLYLIQLLASVVLVVGSVTAITRREQLFFVHRGTQATLRKTLTAASARIGVWLTMSTLMVPVLRVLFGAFDCTRQDASTLRWDRDPDGHAECFRDWGHILAFCAALVSLPVYLACAWRLSHVEYDVREWGAAPGMSWLLQTRWWMNCVRQWRQKRRGGKATRVAARTVTMERVGLFTRTAAGSRLNTYLIPFKVVLVLVEVTLTRNQLALSLCYVIVTSGTLILTIATREFLIAAAQRMVRVMQDEGVGVLLCAINCKDEVAAAFLNGSGMAAPLD